ncbi:MAG: class I SAM-dependent methyltransferase [Dehalococcoidia bacterium]|nr:class I SAM-dependent methyltransferase [Dehalococcoidia bacterium]
MPWAVALVTSYGQTEYRPAHAQSCGTCFCYWFFIYVTIGPMEGSSKDPEQTSTYLKRGVRHGVTVFDMERPDFYEGMWPEPDMSAGSIRNWLIRKQRFFINGLDGKRGSVLDLGCGGGWKLFTTAGPVTGVDLSSLSLRGASSIYVNVAVADLARLPFASNSFDIIVSSDVIGHIPPEHKDSVIREISRVLKPDGCCLHYIETEGDDPLTRFAKGYPELYQRYIIGPEGHEGLESPAATTARFRRAGFKPIEELSAYKMLMYVHRVAQLYDNEYKRQSRLLRLVVALSKLVSRFSVTETLANVMLAVALEVTDRVLPDSWGSGVMLKYGK